MKNAIFALLLIFTIGCTTSQQTTQKNAMSDQNIENTRWVLVEMDGKPIPPSVQNQVYIFLTEKDKQLSGSNGCNRLLGSYNISNGLQIKFDNVATTRMLCHKKDWNEAEFNEILETVNNYTISDDKLMLNVGKRMPLATFVKVKEDGIVNKYWKLIELDGKEVSMADNQEREQYFIIRNDGTITGFAGCNQFSGNYKLEEKNLRIQFDNILSTLRSCPDVAVDEAEFLKVFETADNYTMNNNKLMLNVGRRMPLAVFEAVYFD